MLSGCNFTQQTEAQSPPFSPILIDADLTADPITVGLEWEVSEAEGKIKFTWFIRWFDQGAQEWMGIETVKSLYEDGDDDYDVFYDSFLTEGFPLIIDLPEGGNGCQVSPGRLRQYMEITSAKVYGF